MTRDEAIDHIWGLSASVDGEFNCGRADSDELQRQTREALEALGVHDERNTP